VKTPRLRSGPARYIAGPALAASVLIPLWACSSTRPAAPIEAGSFIPLTAPAAASAPLSGAYRVTFTAPLVGTVHTAMIARPDGNGFVATTREGVAWDFIGGIEGIIGSAFVPKLFPKGIILTWNSPMPTGAEPVEGRIGAGKYKNASVITRMASTTGDIEVVTKEGRRLAVMRLEPLAPEHATPTNYPALAQNVDKAVKDRLFDRELAGSGPVRGYLNRLRKNARIASDDVEFIFGAAVAGRNVKFSLPLVMKNGHLNTEALTEGWSETDLSTITVEFDDQTRIATIRVEAFLGAEDVDKAFTSALAHNPDGIFIDLKDCPGVTLASLRVLSWISAAPVDAGDFFGQHQRSQMLGRTPPMLPTMKIDSAAAVEAIEAALDQQGALSIRVDPVPSPFTGPVAVRISKRTTTSAEPLVQILRSTGRARLFGEATAGRPYISRPIDIGQDWVLWLATSDYRGPLGERITRGIDPHQKFTSKSAAREAATAWLQQRKSEADHAPTTTASDDAEPTPRG
jgi:hypothetical protein